jgi:hypothetical protein
MESQEDMAGAGAGWYRADEVDQWARLAHGEIVRLREELHGATGQALGTEQQLQLLTAAEHTIAGEADRSLGAIARARAATDSALVQQACEAANELVLDAHRRALDVLAQIGAWIGDLYNWGWHRQTAGGQPSEWCRPGEPLSLLYEELVHGVEPSEEAKDRAGAGGLPQHIRPVHPQLIGLDVIDLTGGTGAPDSPGDHRVEIDRVLAEARHGARRIVGAVRKVLTASFDQAESDLLAPSPADRDAPGEQSA